MYSCGKFEPLGKDDSIKPSLREYSFDANGGSVTITTEGSIWHMESIYISSYDKTYPLNLCGKEYSDVYPYKVSCDILADRNGLEPKVIEHQWFSVTKEDPQKLIVEFKPNDTQQKRRIRLDLNSGNYFPSIIIAQSAE
jgi:hypothetical protein